MRSVAIAGLPRSGKTTFLAALYFVLCEGEEQSGLKLAKLPEHATYLSDISKAWAEYSECGRTAEVPESAELEIVDSTGSSAVICFPDLSGEEFTEQWAGRRWSRSYSDLLRRSDGLMLFISPEVREPALIVDYADLIEDEDSQIEDESDLRGGKGNQDEGKVDAKLPKHKEFEPRESPHDVQLVEILQYARTAKPNDMPIRIAVVLSAWDSVVAQVPGDPRQLCDVTPRSWLLTHLPLLHQFLTNNPQLVHEVFGVSAQGGDYTKDLAALKKKLSGAERAWVQQDQEIKRAITLPLSWLLEL